MGSRSGIIQGVPGKLTSSSSLSDGTVTIDSNLGNDSGRISRNSMNGGYNGRNSVNSAGGRNSVNGVSVNGVSVNGVSVNGVSVNGVSVNGGGRNSGGINRAASGGNSGDVGANGGNSGGGSAGGSRVASGSVGAGSVGAGGIRVASGVGAGVDGTAGGTAGGAAGSNMNSTSNLNSTANTDANLLKKSESNSVISSFLSAAHNVMSQDKESKSTKSKEDGSFIHTLENLLKPSKIDSSNNSIQESNNPSASQINIQPIRESPLKTLGNGNLTLDSFLNLPNNSIPELKKSNSTKKISTLNRDRSNSRISEISQTQSNISSDLDSDFTDDETENSTRFSSEKRNSEFHQLFKNIPQTEKLIDNFSCALSKDILVHGRMYLSKNYLCFSSNILGWVTHLVIPLKEVIQVQKKSTAVLFPNGIVVRTLHQKYIFATFLSRDHTVQTIKKVWNLVAKDGKETKRRKRGLVDSANSKTLESSDSEDEDDDDDEDVGSITNSNGEDDAISDSEADDEMDDSNSGNDGKSFNGLPLIGPQTHEPTENGYTKDSGDTFICDENIKAPLGVIFNLLFGSDTSYYIKMLKEQKNFDISEDTIKGLSDSKKERQYSYIKPLGGSIGPKQTKCNLTDKIIEYDLEKVIIVEVTTQTPDVPSGNSFKIKSKWFLSWAENNSTNIYSITNIEWTGKSWIKGAIEKGSIDGQKQSMKETVAFLNNVVASGGGKGKKGKKKGGRSRSNTVKKSEEPEPTPEPEPEPQGGVLDSFISFVESIGALLPIPMLSDTITGSLILVITLILSFTLFGKVFFGSSSSKDNSKFQIIPGDAFVSRVKINDKDFMLMPTVETNLSDEKLRKDMEVSLWNWIEDRSNHHLKVLSDSKQISEKKYTDQILRQVVENTEGRLKELSDELREKT